MIPNALDRFQTCLYCWSCWASRRVAAYRLPRDFKARPTELTVSVCCTTFTGCKSRNDSRFGWQYWHTAVRTVLFMIFTIWRKSSHREGFVRRRLKHWSSQPRCVLRSAMVPSLLHWFGCRTAFSSASIPAFLKHFRTIFLPDPFCHSNILLRLILSPCFSAVLCTFYSVFHVCIMFLCTMVLWSSDITLQSGTSSTVLISVKPEAHLKNCSCISVRNILR